MWKFTWAMGVRIVRCWWCCRCCYAHAYIFFVVFIFAFHYRFTVGVENWVKCFISLNEFCCRLNLFTLYWCRRRSFVHSFTILFLSRWWKSWASHVGIHGIFIRVFLLFQFGKYASHISDMFAHIHMNFALFIKTHTDAAWASERPKKFRSHV